jgi:cytidylate kinase
VANPSIRDTAQRVRDATARCSRTRLILIDGPAGSGKSTLADRLAVALGGEASAGAGTFRPDAPLAYSAPVQILHGDDLYEGWSGLATLPEVLLGQILEPLAAGAEGAFHMWDWVEGRRTHEIRVPQREFLIVEGVGVGMPRARELAVLTVFVDAPAEERLRRGIARDGAGMLSEWQRWQATETDHLAAAGLPAAADVVVDGTAPIPDK